MNIEDILNAKNISLDVLKNESHPAYFAHRERMLSLYKEGYLQEQQLQALIQVAPHLLSSIKEVAVQLGKSQREAIGAQAFEAKSVAAVLERLAEKAETDDARMQIGEQAIKINIDNNATIRDINKRNNRTWERILWVLGIIGTFLGGYQVGKNQAGKNELGKRM